VADDLRFTEPRYTVADAARYVGMPPSTLASWAKGYTKHFADRPTVKQGPVITSLPSVTGSGATIPFIGLVEATVVQAFRQTGLPLQRVRRALQVLADQGELEHALASKRLYTDGAQVLYDYASTSGDQLLRLLTVVDSGQRVFHEVISDYLRRITFEDSWATGLILPVTRRELLRVRPTVASGDPPLPSRRGATKCCRIPLQGRRVDAIDCRGLRSTPRGHRGGTRCGPPAGSLSP